MRFWKLLTHILLTVLLALGVSGIVNAKVASGAQNLIWTGHQADGVVNWLTHRGKSARSTTGPPGSPVAPKSVKPAISAQKQAGHIPGTPQNANRLKQGKPTSSFFGEKSGNRLTQQAFEKGKPVPGRPNVREHDFGVSTGTGPNGGMQSRVRVHQDSKGRIHGHPSGPERF